MTPASMQPKKRTKHRVRHPLLNLRFNTLTVSPNVLKKNFCDVGEHALRGHGEGGH